MSANSKLSVALDACVLAPMPLCDTLLRCAEAGIFHAYWSPEILAEVRRTLTKFGYSTNQISRRVEFMSNAFPEAMMVVPPALLETVPKLPDPGDRHVVAAALASKANAIVTSNLRDFPKTALASVSILVYSPDELLSLFWRKNREELDEILRKQAQDVNLEKRALLKAFGVQLAGFVSLVGGTGTGS